LHGEAVVQGMFFIFNYAYAKSVINYSHYRLSTELLVKYGFKSEELKYKPTQIVEIMKKDKKAQQDKITFIVPTEKKKVKEITLAQDEVKKMF
jgi:3-dehydroquinate synthetase